MAKQSYSQASTRANATDARPSAAKDGEQRATRKQIPQARRGSVTRPVKHTPWTMIISGALGLMAVIVVVALVIVHNTSASAQVENVPALQATPALNTAAPDFNVKAKDGTTLTKANIAGKPTLMVFFASWCPHCQAEAPKLKALAEANPNLNIVAIGVGYNDTQQGIYDFQSKFSLPFRTYDDGGKAASVYGVNSYPTLVSVDASGMIRDRDTGEVTQERLNSLVAKANGQ